MRSCRASGPGCLQRMNALDLSAISAPARVSGQLRTNRLDHGAFFNELNSFHGACDPARTMRTTREGLYDFLVPLRGGDTIGPRMPRRTSRLLLLARRLLQRLATTKRSRLTMRGLKFVFQLADSFLQPLVLLTQLTDFNQQLIDQSRNSS